MRRVLTAIVVALCLGGAALAEDEAPPLVIEAPDDFVPEFSETPSARDFVRHYPQRALDQGVAGVAILCCVAGEDRYLTCRSVLDAPNEAGFGTASERVARSTRLSQNSYTQYLQRPQPIQRLMVWRLDTTSPEFDRAVDELKEATRNVCRDAAPPA